MYLSARLAPPTLIVPRRQWIIVCSDNEVVIIGKEVLWMKNGRIVKHGTSPKLFDAEEFSFICESSFNELFVIGLSHD